MNDSFGRDDRPDAGPGFWRTNRGIGTGLTLGLLLLLAYLLSSDWVYTELRDGFRLGAVPVAGVVAMLLCTVTLIFDGYRGDVPQRLRALRPRDWLYAVLLLLASWLLFEMARLTSTLIAAPLFLLILAYLLGVRPWTAAVLAAAIMGGTVYTVFYVLGIELPHGALPF